MEVKDLLHTYLITISILTTGFFCWLSKSLIMTLRLQNIFNQTLQHVPL